jgi:hypothetical protein
MSSYSSQSIFQARDFQPILIRQTNERHEVLNFKFSKNILKIVQWPHETDCKINTIDYKAEKQVLYSFGDCVNSCIFRKMYSKYECIQLNERLESLVK